MKPGQMTGTSFRKHYLQIAAMLMFSTLIVLALMAVVYIQLRIQLSRDGQASLQSEAVEVQDLFRDELSHAANHADAELSDDRGQNVYFTVARNGAVVYQSAPQPLSVDLLRPRTQQRTFSVVQYLDKPYRVYQYPWTYRNTTYQIYIYKLITQEVQTLRHVRNLMVGAGAAGVAVTVGINLWIAYRALAPARRTWKAHQEMMVELSHELQTPLATIQAVISSNRVDAHVRDNVLKEVSYASGMVRDILYLSNLQTRIREKENEPVAVSDLTEEIVERLQQLANARHITLQGQAIGGLYVFTTSERWSRLVSTVIKNVVDHSVPDSTAHWILTPRGHFVEFAVTNEIPAHEWRKNRKGLGLVIVGRLVQDMDGSFEMKTETNLLQTVIHVPLLRLPRL